MPTASLNLYVALAAVLFALGGIGVLVRRSPLAILMCVELMWNAANLLFLAFARQHGNMDGHIMAFLVITVAAAEVAIGLAITVLIFRKRDHADVDDISELKN
ncbi:MAG TPA: NADH-quinone oxidoreductase subunit NuoK [Symbiobacteriaceae bacterium]|nr:NADH-quinone oxidoreductase subunit NuoK [Symbiobacteriaceae bacterium]